MPPAVSVAPPARPVARERTAGTGRWFLLGLAVAAGILALALYWPVAPFDGSHLPAGATEDPAQAVWFLAWVPYALAHGHNLFETNFLDVPGQVNLADNTLMPFLGLLGAPVTVLLGPVAAYNVLLRAAFVVSTVAMAVPLREVCRTRTAVAAGALLYGFSPYLMTEGFGDAHLNLAFVPFPPLLLWCALRYLQGQRRPALLGACAGLLIAAQAYVAPDLVAALGILALAGVVALAVGPRLRRRVAWRSGAGAAVASAVVFAVLTGPLLYWSVAGPGHLKGAVEQPKFLQAYHGDLLGPVVPTVRQLLAPSSLVGVSNRFTAANPTEHLAYLGLPLVLVLAAITVRCWRDSVVRLAAVLGVVAFVLSLGPTLSVANRTTGIPLPEAVLGHMPLLDSTVPARFALEVVLFAAVVLARGIDRWLAAWRHGVRPVRPALLAVALVVCALTLLPSFGSPEAATGPTDAGAALGRHASGAVVLAYPYPKTPYNEAMLWAAVDGMSFRLIGGYAIVRGPTGNGVMNGPLLDPPAVQEYLVILENGGVPLFYPPPPGGRATAAELCAFLRRYRVDDVLMARHGVAGEPRTKSLVAGALGPPTRTTSDFESWRVPAGGPAC